MPQLDPSSFSSQLFWLAIALVLILYIVSRRFLPAVTSVLESRNATVSSNLKAASDNQSGAEELRVKYESAIYEARDKAVKMIGEVSEKVAKESAKRNRDLDIEIEDKLSTAEKKIEQLKKKARGSMQEAAEDVAYTIISRLDFIKADKADVKKSVSKLTESD